MPRVWGRFVLKVPRPYADYLWRLCEEGEVQVRSYKVKRYLNRLARQTLAFSYVEKGKITIYFNMKLRKGKRYNGYATFLVRG